MNFAAAASLALLTPRANGADIAYRVVALSQQQAPGTATQFGDLGTPTINNAGHVAFASGLVGGGAGAWIDRSDSGPSLLAWTGTVIPGGPPGAVFSDFRSLRLNDVGDFAFNAELRDSVTGSFIGEGIWRGSGTSVLQKVAVRGELAPGTAPSTTFTRILQPLLNNNGDLAVPANVTPAGTAASASGVWIERAGAALTLVARGGQQAPGTPPSTIFSSATFTNFVRLSNDAGVHFWQLLSGPGVSSSNDRGLWQGWDSSDLALLVREGDQVTGDPVGSVWTSIPVGSTVNARGQSLIEASTSQSGSGLFVTSAGAAPRTVLLNGAPAPGMPTGVVFGSSDSALGLGTSSGLNNLGQVAVSARISGPAINYQNDEGVWLERDGSPLTLIAREGEQAPGMPTGVVFRGFLATDRAFDVAVNDHGQLAFLGNTLLTGTNAGYQGIWAADVDGLLRLVVAEGQMFDINPDPSVQDLRLVDDIMFDSSAAGQEGLGAGFNVRGEIAFWARFDDGSRGIFVATIPAPATATMLGVCGFAVLRRRHRR